MEIVAGLIAGAMILAGVAYFAMRARDEPPLRQRLGPRRLRWWEVGSSVGGRFSNNTDDEEDNER